MSRLLALPILPVACVLWFLVPAQAAPSPRSGRVTIHLHESDLLARPGHVNVHFNPTELPVTQQVPWKKGQASEGDAPPVEFTAGQARSMSFELFFDLFEAPEPDRIVEAFQALVGKQIPITWAGQLWMGTLQASKLHPVNTKKGASFTLDTTWSDLTPVDPTPRHPFTVEIPGAPEARTMIREVAIDPFVPNGERGRARFVIASPQGLNPDLLKWQQEASARRAIKVSIFGEDGSWRRTYALDAEGPIKYAIDDPRAGMPYATLEVAVAGVVFETRPLQNPPPPPPPPAPGAGHDPLPFAGFSVTLTAADGSEATGFFKSIGGLKTETEVTDYEEGGIVGSTRKLIGVTKWPHLTLVGDFRMPNSLFMEWLNGKPMTVSIAPLYVLDGKPYPHRPLVLPDLVPDRYVFPRLSAIRPDGDPVEKISLPPALGVRK